MTVFDGIDPTDIVQGKIANCYFLAAVAGLAEDPPDLKAEEEKTNQHISDGMSENQINRGLRLRDNFKTKEVNDAGCYCIVMTVDGEDLEVVVDDWFPFYIDSSG